MWRTRIRRCPEKETVMKKTCTLNEFLLAVKPWISEEYIRKAYLDDEGNLVLDFRDGVRNVYQIDDCTAGQIKTILKDFKKSGIKVIED
jgi:hypothetical protein